MSEQHDQHKEERPVNEPQRWEFHPEGQYVLFSDLADLLAAVREDERRTLTDGERHREWWVAFGMGKVQGQRDALANQTCDDHKDNISISCGHYWQGCEDERAAAVQRVEALFEERWQEWGGCPSHSEVIAAIKGGNDE